MRAAAGVATSDIDTAGQELRLLIASSIVCRASSFLSSSTSAENCQPGYTIEAVYVYLYSSLVNDPARFKVSTRLGGHPNPTHRLLALAACNRQAIFILTPEKLLLIVFNDDLVLAMGALL